MDPLKHRGQLPGCMGPVVDMYLQTCYKDPVMHMGPQIDMGPIWQEADKAQLPVPGKGCEPRGIHKGHRYRPGTGLVVLPTVPVLCYKGLLQHTDPAWGEQLDMGLRRVSVEPCKAPVEFHTGRRTDLEAREAGDRTDNPDGCRRRA